ncbi:hypothetical protein WJX74_006093 [Apatococcus lobatus]|uniref:Thioredoxin domain-containing protein n=1 Tax=Apatococcus lobatus TaxID=904363 RepID=A0AAW1RN88_9CHLO
MATRLASVEKRSADMTRQDSSGLPAVVTARTSSAELVHGLKHKPAATFSLPSTLQPFKNRSPSRTARSAVLTATTVEQSAKSAPASQKPVDFFPAQFQPTPAGTTSRVLTMRSSDEFWDQIDANPDRLVVLMSKSYGCRPCKAFNKKFERVAGQNQDAVFLEIFGDENEDTRAMMIDMCVKVTPTFHMFKGGRLCHMHTGINEENLKNAVSSHRPHYDPAQP